MSVIHNETRVAKKYLALQQSARSRGIPFTLTLNQIRVLLAAKACYYTNVLFVSDRDHLNSRTIDRVDNSKGYEWGNVVPCCKWLNEWKGNKSIEEIGAIVVALEDIKWPYKTIDGTEKLSQQY